MTSGAMRAGPGTGGAETGRFRDPLTRLHDLAGQEVLVVCPRCLAQAVVAALDDGTRWVARWPRRLVCTSCAYTATWDTPRRGSVWGAAADPYFQLPLWLTTQCCGGHT